MKKYPHGLTLNAVCAAVDDYQRHEDSVPEEGILAAFNTLLGHSDIADALRSMERTADANMAAAQAMRDDMYHWKQRAEAAEAKLAELAKQEPVACKKRLVNHRSGVAHHWTYHGEVDRPSSGDIFRVEVVPLYEHPALAADLAELMPDKMTADGVISMHDCGVVEGWNDCCNAILRNIEEAK